MSPITRKPSAAPSPASASPTSRPTWAPNYCPDGYDDVGTRYNWALGRITIVFTHEQCSDRCTQFSAPQFNGGCKAYMTGMYFGMLFCRSYGGNFRTMPCPTWGHPNNAGIGSGGLGVVHRITGQQNLGGNCCSNMTFVAGALGDGGVT